MLMGTVNLKKTTTKTCQGYCVTSQQEILWDSAIGVLLCFIVCYFASGSPAGNIHFVFKYYYVEKPNKRPQNLLFVCLFCFCFPDNVLHFIGKKENVSTA